MKSGLAPSTLMARQTMPWLPIHYEVPRQARKVHALVIQDIKTDIIVDSGLMPILAEQNSYYINSASGEH